VTKFTAKAHESGMLADQAKQMLDWMAETHEAMSADAQKKATQAGNEALQALRSEWGEAWDKNLGSAKLALKEYATEDQIKYFREQGFGRDPMFLRFLSSVSKTLSEDTLRGGGGNGAGGTLTPAQALTRIEEIKSNKAHPYWDPQHAGHIQAKKEFTSLFAQAFPPKNEAPL